MSGSWVRRAVCGDDKRRLALTSGCLVAALAGAGCRAVVGIESRPEVVDADTDAGADVSSDADAGADLDADASFDADAGLETCPPCDAATEAEAGPALCNALQSAHLYDQPDSGLPPLGPANSGPRMARLGGIWSMVWEGENRQSVPQVSIRDNGDVFRFGPLVSVPEGVELYDPMVAAADDRLILGVSRSSAGAAAVELSTFDPGTGTILDGPEMLSPNPATAPLVLSGIASAPGKNRFLTVTREAVAAGVVGPISVHLYQTDPLQHLDAWALMDGTFGPLEAYHATVAWSETAQRFGVAFLDNSLLTRGWIAFFDLQAGQNTLSAPSAIHEFTSGTNWPLAAGEPFNVSVSANGDDFVVAWLDQRESSGGASPEEKLDVYAVSVHSGNGSIAPPGGMRVRGDGTIRRFPSVLADGSSLLVAWIEKETQNHTLRAQRLDTDLHPLGGLIEIGELDQMLPGRFGAVAAGERDYGFASFASGSDLYFNRIACAGP